MKLEKIGFYTLNNKRAKTCHKRNDLRRGEILITNECNFNCPYCRHVGPKRTSYENIKNVINIWSESNVKNIRFSGGEPTLHPDLKEIIRYAKLVCKDLKNIAISTNGYADFELYRKLITLGVTDFSISLDGCCASGVKEMSGGVNAYDRIIDNIRKISQLTYVTVGIVLTEQNIKDLSNIILFADKLGVSDIRIITAAQWDAKIAINVPPQLCRKYPILNYRLKNIESQISMRGLNENDNSKCNLMLDDMAVMNGYHYPCIIKMREGCEPIGKLTKNWKQERINYIKNHSSFKDPICRKNCLDVCRDYNNKTIFKRCDINLNKGE